MNTPQPFPLNQISTLADKQTIACIAGTLKKVWPPKTGTNANGEWSIQNAVLTGDDGTEIPLWLKDRPELPSHAANRRIVLTANNGQKGLSGLYALDDNYNGAITRKIKVTPTAILTYPQDAPAQETPPQAQPPAADYWPSEEEIAAEAGHQAAPAHQSTVHQSKHHQPRPDSVPSDTKKELMRIVNLQILCQLAVRRVLAPTVKRATGSSMDSHEIQAGVASLFIKADKLNLHTQLPCRPLSDDELGIGH